MRKLLTATAILAIVSSPVIAASVPFISTWDPGNPLGSLNAWIQGSLNPNVAAAGGSAGNAGAVSQFPKNTLDNGGMFINQRAVTATCATTSGVIETSYSADRWACDVNMTTGAGQLSVVTSSPTPPIGFVNESKLVRASGALSNPVCAWQELPNARATSLSGQTVDFSVYMQALAGLSADNGNLANLYVIAGTDVSSGSVGGLGGLRGAVGMTSTVKASSFTISSSTGLITNASTVVAGQPVTMTAAVIPTGIVSSQIYYVSTSLLNSGTAFAVADTYAHAIAGTNTVIPSTTGTTNVINIPYITPVWTGLSVLGSGQTGAGTSAQQEYGAVFSNPFTLSASAWGRFQTGPVAIPAGTTEVAVAVCFTPNGGSSGGATDGIAFTGAQLEVLGTGITTASPFEFRSPQDDLAAAQRFAVILPETAASLPWGSFNGTYTATTTCEMRMAMPVTMDIAPLITFTGTALSNATGAIIANSATPIVLATTYIVQSAVSTTNTPGAISITTTTAGKTAGFSCMLVGAGGGAVINVGADF